MIGFNDGENTSPTLDANQLPVNEQMVNADEALAETIKDTLSKEEEGGVLSANIIHTVQSRYEEAKRSRDTEEQRWLQSYHNYRGLRGKNVKYTEHEKSSVFVKVTKTKVLAAYGQLIDVLFGTNKFPISISETEVPEGVATTVHLKAGGQSAIETGVDTDGIEMSQPDVSLDPYNVGYPGDGLEVPPGATQEDITKGLQKQLVDAAKGEWAEGASHTGDPEFHPAKEAAERMEKLIHDQIEASNGAQELRSALFEAALLGTGIIKGPFTYERTIHNWRQNSETNEREYAPKTEKVPKIEFCSVWDAFPDPNAKDMSEAEWFIQRHKMSRSQLRGLKDRPLFDTQAINEALQQSPNYVAEDYESQIDAENKGIQPTQDRYEVLEYWGMMDGKDLKNAGFDRLVRDELDEVQVNVWVCHGKLLRVALNPFTPKRIPYLAFDYERNPYSFFGVGVAENMSDAQQIMNGHIRMAIDNLALAGHMVFDVDENALAPGQNMEVYPGKVFKRQGGMPGQAVHALKFNSTANENMQIFDKFRQIADEATGIPSYSHGQTGVMSTTRTAAGMSMLMGASSLNVKTVVKNVDDFLLQPLGEAMFQWNMSFYSGDLEIVGDLEIKAGGAASLMQNEIKSQRLTAFGQLFQNPAIAPFIKIPEYVKAFVESLDLDPEKLINDENQARVYAAIMGAAGGVAPPGMPTGPAPAPGVGELGGVPAPEMPMENTGNIEGM